MMSNDEQTFWLENLKVADNYNDWIFSQIFPYLGAEVLEVGCGNGNFTIRLACCCKKVVALDLNKEYVKTTKARLQGKKTVEIIQADASNIQWKHSFDTIVMLDVLEHIEDDINMLRNLSSYLKPDGKLVIKVPALNFLYSRMDQAVGHYRRYNKNALKCIFEQANFAEPLIWYFNATGIFGWWLNGKIFCRTKPMTQQVSLFNKLVPMFKNIENIVQVPIGLSLFAVGTPKKSFSSLPKSSFPLNLSKQNKSTLITGNT